MEVVINKKCCEICGADKGISKYSLFNKYLCPKHYYQFKKFGKPMRTKYDINEIEIVENAVYIICVNSRYEVTGKIIIDLEDYEKVKKYRWRLDNHMYGYNNSNKNIFIHNLIIDVPKNMVVDHIDGNPLNNKKNNLRLVTRNENNLNHKVNSANKTGVTGVGKGRQRKWRARINFNNKEFNLGEFDCFLDAVCKRAMYESFLFEDKSRNYDSSIKKFVFNFKDNDDKKQKKVVVDKPIEVTDFFIEETSIEVIESIDSERGKGKLGSSGK